MKNYDLSQLEVLILEENQFMRRLLRAIMRELGIRSVREVDNPYLAFKLIQENDIDLVFSNWAPGLDALRFLKEVRTSPDCPNPTLPIIVVSAYTEINHVLAARDFGMTEFLAKPVAAETVYHAMIESKRSFIKSQNFVGPDRRRKRGQYPGMDRRTNPPIAVGAR